MQAASQEFWKRLVDVLLMTLLFLRAPTRFWGNNQRCLPNFRSTLEVITFVEISQIFGPKKGACLITEALIIF